MFLPFWVGKPLFSRSSQWIYFTHEKIPKMYFLVDNIWWRSILTFRNFRPTFWMAELLRVVEPSGHWPSQTRSNFYPTICFNDQPNTVWCRKFAWKWTSLLKSVTRRRNAKSRGWYQTKCIAFAEFSDFSNAVQITITPMLHGSI